MTPALRLAKGKLVEADHGRLRDLYAALRARPDSQRSPLRLAMRRFGEGLGRLSLTDTAVDFGVVLEVLFGAGKGAPVGLTLRLRAARLLRTDVRERKYLAKFVDGLYGLRCDAAHGGDLRTEVSLPGRPMETRAFLDEAATFLAQAIEHRAIHGPPDWDAVIYA